MSNCTKKRQVTEARQAKRTVLQPESVQNSEPNHTEDLDGLVCWWCVHGLPQRPCVHLPLKYDDRRKEFTTIGNFCSWPCAKAYAIDMGTARSGEIQSILALMRLQTFGRYVPLWPAPKRQALKCFGGTLSIDAFRKFGGLVEPPVVHWPFENRMVVQIGGNSSDESTAGASRTKTTVESRGKMVAIENATKSGDTLKLKRNKPLPRATSKLESALGLKRKGEPKPDP